MMKTWTHAAPIARAWRRGAPTTGVVLAAVLVTLLAGRVAFSGGADPGPKAPAVGLCYGEPDCNLARTSCKFLNECVDGSCPGTFEPCGVAQAALTGDLIISVDDEPPLPSGAPPDCGGEGGTTNASVVFNGRKQDGTTFSASDFFTEATGRSTCNVTNCMTLAEGEPTFFCTTSDGADGEIASRLSEDLIPTAEWLTVHPFPGAIESAIKAQFPGVPGVPVIVRATLVDEDDHRGETDPQPTTLRYCVKVHFAPGQ